MRTWFVKDTEITSYSGTETSIIVPPVVYGNDIDSIGSYAFSPKNLRVKDETRMTRRKISSVVLPEGIKRIGAFAFAGCVSLKYIEIPSSVDTICGNAFDGCVSLEHVSIPKGVTIWKEIFNDCKSLKEFSFPDDKGSAICNSFDPCNSTPMGCFSGCIELENVLLPKNLETINGCTFSGCKSLQSIHIPETVTCIDHVAFSDCTSLSEITIPDGVSHIYPHVFSNCISLEKVVLSNNTKVIHQWAFYGCSALKTIRLPNGLQKIDSEAFQRSGIEEITIPQSVEELRSSAFKDCKSFKRIVIEGKETQIVDDYRWKRMGVQLPFQTGFSNMDTLIIEGVPGSFAEQYAKHYGIRFETIAA